MKFPYVVSDHGFGAIPAPVFAVRVRGQSHTITLEMLVDSGSLETIIPRAFAVKAGIAAGGERIRLAGVGGEIDGEVSSAEFGFRNEVFHSRVVIADTDVPLLGHRDLFERFRITFDDSEGALYLRAHANR
jgi:predicted aspartyl protease